jgi:hypothetical protein
MTQDTGNQSPVQQQTKSAAPKGSYYFRPKQGFLVHLFETNQRLKPLGRPVCYRNWEDFSSDYGKTFPKPHNVFDHIRRRCRKRKKNDYRPNDHIHVQRVAFMTPSWIKRSVAKKKKPRLDPETKSVDSPGN